MNIELDEKQIIDKVIGDLKRHNLLTEQAQNVTVNYIADDQDVLYTIAETAKIMKTNTSYVYKLVNAGLIPVLKLGSYKIRKTSLGEFLAKYEGKDLTDPSHIVELEVSKIE
ncbi:helix-turn-helix domain-containing protein [[Clostridium] fimetarium]|uniref:DNA binding domain-containing protein, excisionase family n=1 Tax=[Clostridium] fimetarium TaxID=99656 RepID=A0A1I0M1G4_9FIRM|nr:helix-turn-helix domain-containing protein [[Clostridium] fimetarium]SEV81529.1 DNA binding domain-containing protein, excisionase family [[Clostridium] fimetarium]